VRASEKERLVLLESKLSQIGALKELLDKVGALEEVLMKEREDSESARADFSSLTLEFSRKRENIFELEESLSVMEREREGLRDKAKEAMDARGEAVKELQKVRFRVTTMTGSLLNLNLNLNLNLTLIEGEEDS